jgi:glycosyltransferase involved in cell wall biosynthesis
MTVRVSVILPTYNRAASLERSCASVLSQSFRDLELLVVDDASTEDIEGCVRGLGDPRVRYIRRERNGGAAAARNTGLAAARGEYIAFQDSDDVWLPGKLAAQVARLEAMPPEVGAVTGAKILYGADHATQRFGPGKVTYAPPAGGWLRLDEDQVKHSLVENRISLQNALFRRDCYPDPQWFDPRAKANADWEFTVRLVQHTKVYEDTEPVVFAYVSEDSISRSKRKKLTGLLAVMNKNKPLFLKNQREFSINIMRLGKMLYRTGRKRAGLRYVLMSLRMDPANALDLVPARMRRIGR